jgi:chemotaxis protein MotB
MARRYKKVEGGHGHHGGAWKVAYADFVTAMMALFMVMWLLASTDAKSRKEISHYFRTGVMPESNVAVNEAAQLAPAVLEAPELERHKDEPIEARASTAKEISEKLKTLGDLDPELARVIRNVNVTITPDGVLIETVDEGDGMLFDLASARLGEPLQRFLHAFAPVIAHIGRPIEINGHTDARPFVAGSPLSNWELSYQRAAAAREILETGGVRREQIVGVIARGHSQLYVPDQPFAAQNRRLSFLVKIAKPDVARVKADALVEPKPK